MFDWIVHLLTPPSPTPPPFGTRIILRKKRELMNGLLTNRLESVGWGWEGGTTISTSKANSCTVDRCRLGETRIDETLDYFFFIFQERIFFLTI